MTVQILTDVHLIVVVLIITGIVIILLVLEEAFPSLRGHVQLDVDMENPQGIDVRSMTLLLLSKIYDVFSGKWSKAKQQSMGVLRSTVAKVLLANLHFCVPRRPTNHRNRFGISNKKSEAKRLERFKVHCHTHLYIEHHPRGTSSRDLCSEKLH